MSERTLNPSVFGSVLHSLGLATISMESGGVWPSRTEFGGVIALSLLNY